MVNAGYTNKYYNEPLVHGFLQNPSQSSLKLSLQSETECIRKLLQGEIELALMHSLGYAKGKGNWKIFPEICSGWRGMSQSTLLFFNNNLDHINSIALEEDALTESALLKILLMEKYELEPVYISMQADPDSMLDHADAALIVGIRSLKYKQHNSHFLDLGEEWHDLTGLPFVSSIWVGHEMLSTPQLIPAFKKAHQSGMENLHSICKDLALKNEIDTGTLEDHFRNDLCFNLGPEEKEGLLEFYRYAFYLGLIEHIPDLHFFG